ncbi:hypothetical protein BTN49_2345 [Candidatus Enterovibrio escicola]|uniref:Uncharacterized protein n=1 Tax=Candidatus Enterovibrio escicola TaxID=1927127 RepID=A0A2A5T1N6_9GAMM|nr:hypothetical protein BTN49_2345 [Candidatus Enterovibrio escacola]
MKDDLRSTDRYWLANYLESQLDLLESRHALEVISTHFSALWDTEEDLTRMCECH